MELMGREGASVHISKNTYIRAQFRKLPDGRGDSSKTRGVEDKCLLLQPGSQYHQHIINIYQMDFPGGAVDKNLPANAGDTGSMPGQEDPTGRRATKPVSHNY